MKVYHFLQFSIWLITIKSISCFLFPSFYSSFQLRKSLSFSLSSSSSFSKLQKINEKKFEIRKPFQQTILFSSNSGMNPDLLKKSFSSTKSIDFPEFTPPPSQTTTQPAFTTAKHHAKITPFIQKYFNVEEAEHIKNKIDEIYTNPAFSSIPFPPSNQLDAQYFGNILHELAGNFAISNDNAFNSFVQHAPWLLSHYIPQ
jgi:hypothetical protein